MKLQEAAQELNIYVGDDDQWSGGPLYAAVVERLKATGLAGASVYKGVEGYGSHGRVHSTRVEVLFEGLPVLIRVVDVPDRISAALSSLDEILTDALVTVKDVTAIRYIKSPKS